MTTKRIFQGMLSGLLAASLCFSLVFSVRAEELTEETVQETTCTDAAETLQTTSPTEETTVPEETIPVTEAEDTIPVTETTETEPEETPLPETTEATEPALQPPEVISIAEAIALPANTENITIQGTVVFAAGTLAVLQDGEHSIRLAFEADPELVPGEILQVTGIRSGGLYVEDFEVLGTGALPYVEETLKQAPDSLRVCIRNAAVTRDSVAQSDFSMDMESAEPVTKDIPADVYGVILDGCFYADAILPVEPMSVRLDEEGSEWNFYFGRLHAHSNISDGEDSVEEMFQYAAESGMDFFAVTDLSDSMEDAEEAREQEGTDQRIPDWESGKAAATTATVNGAFVGIYGYEMSWSPELEIGHISTFNTSGWRSCQENGMDELENYYEVLASEPASISQFNHPGPQCGDFRRFSDYAPEYDAVMHLIEVGTGEDAYAYYDKALKEGWHLSPSHFAATPHSSLREEIPSSRTVVLAEELTEQHLYNAIRAHRVYTTEDSDLQISYTLNGSILGSTIWETDTLTASVVVQDPTDSETPTVEVVAGGKTFPIPPETVSDGEWTLDVPGGYDYYYIKVTQPDGDTAVTAPVWVENYDNVGILNFSSSNNQPMQGETVMLELEVYNQEETAFSIETVTFYENGALLEEIPVSLTVEAVDTRKYSYLYSCADPGEVQITALVTGTMDGVTKTREETLILRYQAEQTEVCSIETARAGDVGMSYRVRGYITAGNDMPEHSFANTLYLQDDTGGIAVTGYVSAVVELGTPLEVTGVLRKNGRNTTLELTDFVLLEQRYQEYAPRTMSIREANDYEANGGELLKIEGSVVSLTKTADGKGISRLTLQDFRGDTATVLIEDHIRSSTYDTNELAKTIKKGRTVQASGLLHVDEYGKTVLRVRNCDEVVYIPAMADPSNPKTGDRFRFWQ